MPTWDNGISHRKSVLRSIDEFLVDRIFEPIVLRAASFGRTAPWIAGNIVSAALVVYAVQIYFALSLLAERPFVISVLILAVPCCVLVHRDEYKVLRALHDTVVTLGRPIASPFRESLFGRLDRVMFPAGAAFQLLMAGLLSVIGEEALFRVLALEVAKLAMFGIAAFFAACTAWPPEPPARRREAGARALPEGAPS